MLSVRYCFSFSKIKCFFVVIQIVLIVTLVYIVFLVAVHALKKPTGLSHLLRMPQNTGWLVGGVVLFVTMYSTSSAGLVSAIVTEKGPHDLLIVWASLIPLGFLPMVFAPLWAKLNFISENEFLTLRYAQPWAKRLRNFRAFYVGGLVVPILLAFSLLAFVDVIATFAELSKPAAIALVTAAMMLNSWRASYREKSVIDMLHFVAFLVPLIVVACSFTGSSEAIRLDLSNQPLLPEPLLLVAFLGVQWWSAQIIDGAGIEAQQLMGTDRRKAVRTTLTMSVLFLVVSSLVLYVSLHSGGDGIAPGQQAYLEVIQAHLPDFLHPVMAIGMLGIFLSTFEAVQLWGCGLLLSGMDGQLATGSSARASRLVMTATALVSGLIAWQSDQLTVLLEFLLGLTAGVGLVYILRWFWWRINSQVQLVAMLLPIVLIAVHKAISILFNDLAWIRNMEYPSVLLVYTAVSLVVVAATMWLTNQNDDRVAFSDFARSIDLQQQHVLPSIAKALLFGFGLLAIQLLIAYSML